LSPAAIFLAGCGTPHLGDAPADRAAQTAQPGCDRVQAIPVILPPLIDGKLDEGVWQQPPGYSSFMVVGQPNRPARRRTIVQVAYDASNLYIALACPTDTSIGPPKVRHWQDDDEAIHEDESCRILLWPEPSPPGVCFELTVNPRGVVYDARRHWDYLISSAVWDGPTRAAAAIGQGVWQAELMVPLQQVGVPDKPWRMNVIRHDALAGERSSLAPIHEGTTAAGHPPSAVLYWPAPARSLLTAPLPVRQFRLDDMEDSLGFWRGSGCTWGYSDTHVMSGRRSLEVGFAEGGGRVGRAFQQASFSGWQTLRFGLFLDGQAAFGLGVGLRDVLGRTRTAWFPARPGANDIALPLDLVCAGLQHRNIKAVEFISRGKARIWLSDIRLEEDALSFHEKPNRPVRQSRSGLELRIDPAILAHGTSTPVAVDVTVPLFGTRKVRRLEGRSPVAIDRFTFASGDFVGHDVRDPIRAAAFFVADGQCYFAFREVRLSQPWEVVTFAPGDFPPPAPASGEEIPDTFSPPVTSRGQ
jgi:hypothetical protein